MLIDFAEKSLIGKAKERPDLVKQLINKAKREGIINTLQQAMNRLDTLMPLGYSSAGLVVDVGTEVDTISVGDKVACAGGGYACHAEVVFVPKNLCVKIPEGVDFEDAACVALGSIAMQGVRIANLALGENVVVIGLGFVGQLTAQLVKACGCNVFCVDIDADKVKLALEIGADGGAVRGKDDVNSEISSFSQGLGADAVIITAASDSNDPIELAGEISRDRGRVVVVGAVKMDIPRKMYYEKELELRLSRSYGPGRYDSTYEEQGVDYPIGYVRWTEQRNMHQFLNLVAQKKVVVDKLITHRFKIDDADKAYDIITGKTKEKHIGILLEYPHERPLQNTVWLQPECRGAKDEAHKTDGKINIGLIGGGNFAKGVILPNLKNIPNITLRTICTGTGISAKSLADKYGFAYCTSDYSEVLADDSIDCIIVATRHNLHAQLVIEGLKSGKHVFVEKPLALSIEELRAVLEASNESQSKIMVGFNRRFSPFTQSVKEFFSSRSLPLAVNYRINAGFIPKDNWVHDPKEGGGRIIGEVCHFVDLIQYLVGSEPTKVYAETITSNNTEQVDADNINITLKFHDGSVGSISYLANGDKSFPKERVEVFGGGSICVIDDFRSAVLIRNGKKNRLKSKQDKGHKAEFEQFIHSILNNEPSPIDFKEAVITTLTTFKILESLNTGVPVEIAPDIEFA
jgi:predicted dehydrogenase/threonine dehydrogenase-like Zn-dependent dehydrogenase